MVRRPCCDRDREGLKRGAWTEEEDEKLTQYIHEHGDGKWHHLPKHAGIQRCGKSCRLRWVNYLRPGIKRGNFSKEEEETILFHHSRIGNKWSKIAKHLEGRTDNEIKNHYNTRLKRQLKESMQREYMIVPPEPLSSYFATLEAEAKIGRHLLNQLATTANMNIDLGILMSEFQLNEATKTTFMATNHISSSLSSLVPKIVCNDLNYQTPPHTSRPMENINNYGAYNVQSSYQHFLQKSQQRQDSVNFNSEMIIDSGYDNNILWESPNSIPLSGVVSGTYSGEVEVPSVHTILSSMINTNDYGDYTSLMDFQEYSSNSMALVDTLTLQDWLMDNGEDKYM